MRHIPLQVRQVHEMFCDLSLASGQFAQDPNDSHVQLVSDPNSPASWKKTGNFHRLGLARPLRDAKYESRSDELRGNSLRIGTEIFLRRN